MKTVNFQLALIVSLGGLLFGYDTAVIAGAIKNLTLYFSLSDGETGWAVSSALVGCMAGGLIGQYLTDRWGRKKALIFTAWLIFIAAIGTAVPRTFSELVLFRIAGGVGIGMASLAAPVYISEISAKEVRGKMSGLYQLMISGGMLLVYIVNTLISELSDSPQWAINASWRWMFASEIIPAALFLALLYRVPESPRWLVKKRRDAEAASVLRQINGPQCEAESLIRQIRATFEDSQGKVIREPLLAKHNRRVVFAVLCMATLANLCGINAVLYYGNVLVESIGIASEKTAFWQQVIIGLAFFLAAAWAVKEVENIGRRKLLLYGNLGCLASILLLGVLVWMKITSLWMLGIIVVYILLFGGTVGPVLWIILPELSPNAIRDRLMALAVFLIWAANFVVAQTFPLMNGDPWLRATFNGGFPFLAYGFFCLLWYLLTLFFIPETRNKTLEQISSEMQRGVGNTSPATPQRG
ncbi:MFS transporter [Izhakiella australiensis]|uniref:D-xylose-proton symporter n=1 Tax=Izhakiella australiensis TaxID=1926881 RepID=A0A1S8YIX8_9GAMM|nr:sugar porter family MFS transporter [Izhakiella australiensis]OON38666.1 MFS transporter [Izhakiella australiensis]